MLKVLLIIFVVWVLTFVLKVIISMWEERSYIYIMFCSGVLFMLSFFTFKEVSNLVNFLLSILELIFDKVKYYSASIKNDYRTESGQINFNMFNLSKIYKNKFDYIKPKVSQKKFFHCFVTTENYGYSIISTKQGHPRILFLLKDKNTEKIIYIDVNLTSSSKTNLYGKDVENTLVGKQRNGHKSYLCVKDAEFKEINENNALETKENLDKEVKESIKFHFNKNIAEQTLKDWVDMSKVIPDIINQGKFKHNYDLEFNDKRISLEEFKDKLLELPDKFNKKD